MSHIHWVARQNKLDIPRDKDEVNKREHRVVYYESLKRELKTKTTYGYRCDERLKTNVKEPGSSFFFLYFFFSCNLRNLRKSA